MALFQKTALIPPACGNVFFFMETPLGFFTLIRFLHLPACLRPPYCAQSFWTA